MGINVIYRLAGACFCFGFSVGILVADHLHRPLALGADIVVALAAIAIMIQTLRSRSLNWKRQN